MDKNTTAFRERFNAYKNGKPISKIYDAGLPRYAGGKRGYIGGSTKHARETVWNTDQTLNNAVDSIANAYLLKDGLLLHRLNEEGFTDKAIRLYNNARNQSLYTGENLLNNKTDFSGVGDFGLDDAGTMILNNQMLLKGEKWWDEEGENEQGRITHGAVGDTVRDTIGLQASALKYFSDQVKKDYPNLSDYDNARYTQAYYQRGVGGGRKWAKAGAKGYNFSTKPLAMRPAENPYLIQTTIQNTAAPKFGKYANGKLPRYKIGHNVSNAKLNEDGTFTDDYTKMFEDMYVTPQKTDLKRGSYTLNNFPYYLQHRTDWMKPFMSSGTNEKGLELVSPEFDLLFGGKPTINFKKIAHSTKLGLNKTVHVLDKGVRMVNPRYDLYKIISETTPSTTVNNSYIDLGQLATQYNLPRYFPAYPNPVAELMQTMRGVGSKSYFLKAPRDVDVLKLRNGMYRHEVVGNNIIPSGSVDGKFVSYGEPWREAMSHNALYEFPIGQKRGPSLMATDWKGRPKPYSVDEIYDFMLREKGIRSLFNIDVKNKGLDELDYFDRILAYQELKKSKYPELLLNYDTSIYGSNQTVIPNKKWNFDYFLKAPFWKYSDDAASGQLLKTLFMNWPL